MTMHAQVSHICQSASLGLKNIGKIRHFLDQNSTERLIHAFVSSRLDHQNALLYKLPSNVISSLQRVQNSAARLVCKVKWHEHITPVLRKLHWLPLKQRTEYKILLLFYKALNNLAPTYLRDALVLHEPTRMLRSSSSMLLEVPCTRTRYGDRTFSTAAAVLWNSLPLELKTAQTTDCFKTRLKTWLFSQAFPDCELVT